MSRFHSYINTTSLILSGYNGQEPFSSHLKKYFSAQKKHGSGDRKTIAHLCYCYFRAARLFPEDAAEQILKSLFICSGAPSQVLEKLKPEWNSSIMLAVTEKLRLLQSKKAVTDLFPYKDEVSAEVNVHEFAASLLQQPDLFIRIRPGCENSVLKKLTSSGIEYKKAGEMCLVLANGSVIEQILDLDREVVVQDYSSQRIAEFLQVIKHELPALPKIWDCCAASGGKSILAKDVLGNADLTVSDVRESILINLRKRFIRAGIVHYKRFAADLTGGSNSATGHYDLIIADVPCSGSGTWGRTPEQLFYFDKIKIDEYTSLQKKITVNTLHQLKPGGYFLYITCSVFKKENEEIAFYLQQQFNLELAKVEILKGYDAKADTMFAALLRKPL